MFLDSCGDGENVWVKDDVFGWESNLFGQQGVSPAADRNFAVYFRGLPFLVKRHDNDRCSILTYDPGLPKKFFLTSLEADGVHNPLALKALESGLQHAPSRTVDHDRHTGHIWLAGDQCKKLGHHNGPVEHALIDVHIDDVGAPLNLLPCNGQRLLVTILANQPREGARACHVGAFANDGEAALRTNLQHFETGVPGSHWRRGGYSRWMLRHGLGNGTDVWRRGATAATDDVEPALGSKIAEHFRHHLGGFVEAAHGVRQTGIGIATRGQWCYPGQIGQMGAEFFWAKRAVDSHTHKIGMGDAHPTGFNRLG